VEDVLARQMVGQRPPLRLHPLRPGRDLARRLGLSFHLGLGCLKLFQLQLELLDLPVQPFRGLAELHPAQLRELHLQLLDLQPGELYRRFGRAEFGARGRQLGLTSERKGAERLGVGWENGRAERHGRLYQIPGYGTRIARRINAFR